MTRSSTQTNKLTLAGNYTKTYEGETLLMPINFAASTTFAYGVGANQTNLMWIDKDRVLNATTEEIDLVGGGLVDAFADVVSFSSVSGIYIYNKMTGVGEELKVGGAAANTFLLFDDATDIKTVGPEGILYFDEPSLAAMPVTASTGDLLKLDAGATANLTFDIAIWGRSI